MKNIKSKNTTKHDHLEEQYHFYQIIFSRFVFFSILDIE